MIFVGVSGSQLPGFRQGAAAAVTFFLARRFGVDAAGTLQRALRAGPANLDSWNSGGWLPHFGRVGNLHSLRFRFERDMSSRGRMAMFWTNTTQNITKP